MKVFVVQAIICGVCFTLGFFQNPLWFWIPIVLGLNLIQSAFTDFCPISRMLGGAKKTAPAKKSSSKA